MGVPVPQSIIDVYTGRAAYPANYIPTSYVNRQDGKGNVPVYPWITDPAMIAGIVAGLQSASDQGVPGWFDAAFGGFPVAPPYVPYTWMSPKSGLGPQAGGGPVFQLKATPIPGYSSGGSVMTQAQAIASAAFAGGLKIKSLPLMIGNQQAYVIDMSSAAPPPPPDRATAEANATAALAAGPPQPPAPTDPAAVAQTQAVAAATWYPPAPVAVPSGGGGAPPASDGSTAAPPAPAAGGGGAVAVILAALAAAFLS
jgi:hypothetical protein